MAFTAAAGAVVGAALSGTYASFQGGDIGKAALKGAVAGAAYGLTAGFGGPLVGKLITSGIASGIGTGLLAGGASDFALQAFERYTGERCEYSVQRIMGAAAVSGLFGAVVFRTSTANSQRVVSWASKGITPELNHGTWVMTGASSPRNYVFSAKPFAMRYPYTNSIERTVSSDVLVPPSGAGGNLNFLMGQRRINLE